ncbi:hypothetical protein H671_7g17440 [Cricetulus griseus]|nr:hypothetical protein H671_7g17440 [Cricetulus griseus]
MCESAGAGTQGLVHASEHSNTKRDSKPCQSPSDDCMVFYHVDSSEFLKLGSMDPGVFIRIPLLLAEIIP